jgi:iron complex outermembrane receptor protein
MSDVLGKGFIANSAFNTPTLNFLGSYAITPNDLITTKAISNYVATQLPIRLSLSQFQQNPFQKGCSVAATAAPGCATVGLFINGMSGATVPQTAQQAGFGRHDYRNIVGVRWDHDLTTTGPKRHDRRDPCQHYRGYRFHALRRAVLQHRTTK